MAIAADKAKVLGPCFTWNLLPSVVAKSQLIFSQVMCILLLSYSISLYMLDSRPLSDIFTENIYKYFLSLYGCLLIFLLVSLEVQKFLISMNSN